MIKIRTDKKKYEVGEVVKITIFSKDYTSLSISSKTDVYKFLGQNLNPIFIPKDGGIYSIIIKNEDKIIDETTFEVYSKKNIINECYFVI